MDYQGPYEDDSGVIGESPSFWGPPIVLGRDYSSSLSSSCHLCSLPHQAQPNELKGPGTRPHLITSPV